MPLSTGDRLGPYEVTAELGRGGMGEVYRARDTSLDRDVAIKVLPEAFASDPERLARFEREAKVLASLNHPNIAAIYGLEKSGEERALVLELVEGPTLQDRISQGAIPVDEALPIARQIAEALEAAHEQGIIHRDLKPANIKVTPGGVVKVLDFGLAKALEPERLDDDVANSPTMSMTAAATRAGFILGTAAYMSPEQAKGRPVDRRADVWAYGVVLYEMLTGRQAFGGSDISETLAAVLREDMDWSALPDDTPPPIRRLLRRSLARDPKSRLADLSMARLEIDDATNPPEPATASGSSGASSGNDARDHVRALWQRPAGAAGIAIAMLILGGLGVWTLVEPDPAPIVRAVIPLGEQEAFTNHGRQVLAISPDGSHIVYTANNGLSLRPVDRLHATPLAGTSEGNPVGVGGARNPFFSPDGQWIGYHVGNQIRKVSIRGGAPIVVGDVGVDIFGASWGADDTILIGLGADGIWRLPAAGGAAEQLIAASDEAIAYGPQMLPGNDLVLFTSRPSSALWDSPDTQIVAQSLATGERWVLIQGGRDARYLRTGHLVYALDNVLFAVPLDLDAHRVRGGPVSLLEGVRDATAGRSGAVQFSVADNGSLVYVPTPPDGDDQTELVWVDRTGQIEPVGMELRLYGDPRVSPDGTRILVTVIGEDDRDVWIYSLERQTMTRVTFYGGRDSGAIWTPDAERVAFRSDRDGGGLFWKAANGTGTAELLTAVSSQSPVALGWASDTRLVFEEGGDIFVLSVDGERRRTAVLNDTFPERAPAMSPDGRWIAYHSSESGANEVYVRPFPDVNAGRWQVSARGGERPVWSADGDELFFGGPAPDSRGGDSSLMFAVRIDTEPTFSPSLPETLFNADLIGVDLNQAWDAAPDGERFVAISSETGGPGEAIVLVQGWFEELQARVPTR